MEFQFESVVKKPQWGDEPIVAMLTLVAKTESLERGVRKSAPRKA